MNNYANSFSWSILSDIEQRIRRTIEEIGVPLRDWNVQINYGIKTGLNDAFIISGEKKCELIAADPKSAEIIRPILRGRDVKRYGYQFANLYLISTFPSRNYDIEEFPAIKKHLLTFGYERLEQSGKTHFINGENILSRKKTNNKWFETQDSISYWDDFYKQKIIYAETMRVHRNTDSDRFPRFSFSDEMIFLDKTCFMIIGKDLLYLLPIINSKLMNFFIRHNIAVMDVGGFLMQKIYIEQLPVPTANDEIRKALEALTLQIIKKRKMSLNSYELEDEVDSIVNNLFNLTREEVKFIENNSPDRRSKI